MRCNIRSVNSTLRTVRALNDPEESNELNLSLADRYSAGVLDMGVPGENQITLDYAQITKGTVSLNNISEKTNLIVDFGRHHGAMPRSATFR